jgi:hypothetical protein
MKKDNTKQESDKVAQPTNPTHEAPDDLVAGFEFPKSKGDKPLKLTKRTLTRLLKAISNGAPLHSACTVAGIAPSTLTAWRQEYPELDERIDMARERLREKLLSKIEGAAVEDWRAAAELLKLSYAQDYRRVVQSEQKHLHVYGDTHISLSVEQQAALREQRRRIIATSVDAQRTLAGTSATGSGEPAQSFQIKKQSLLAKPQPEQEPEQPVEAEVREVVEAEVIEQQPEQQERPDPAFQEWHKVADARRKEADEAAEAWARLGLR